jgi:3-oxoacyl-[acyl-carrier-protein] synthase-3
MDIELLICATVTPDMLFPATANIITDRIGAKRAWSFDMEAACSSFLYALAVGSQFIETGRYTKIMVVGVDKMSAILDYQDRNTCIIFGDGAGAVLLEPDTEGNGIVDFVLFSDGDGAKHLHMKSGGSLRPPTKDTVLNREHFVYQEGQAVFKRAIAAMADAAVTILEKNALKAEDIAYLVPHQANLRIIDATANRMGLPPERVMVNIQKYGNTTSATLPLCLHDWESKLHKGDNIILASFGGGFTWGAMYLKWGYDPSR